MKNFVLLVAFATVACGLEPGLVVKYGSGSSADKDHFYDLPRTISQAQSTGWKETKPPSGPYPDLKLFCPPGRMVCAYYHPQTHFVSGLQVALPKEQFQWAVIKPEKIFTLWHAPVMGDEPAIDYWTSSQFYVAPGQPGPTEHNGGTLQHGGVWVLGPDGKLMKIPENERELQKTKFVKQNCFPNMGTHYLYNMSREMECDKLFHWFPLVKNGKVIGVGFLMYGRVGQPRYLTDTKRWFEDYSNVPISFRRVMPDSPECLSELMDKNGYIFFHVYFIDKPGSITCESGDSQ